MRRLAPLLYALVASVPLAAQPGSGTRWEVTMQVPGMEGAMQGVQIPEGVELPEGMALPSMGPGGMTQTMCLPKEESEPPPAEENCRILEQRSRGNTHFMRMDCPDGLMELEQTRTDATLDMNMKMTDRSGETMEMAMTGRATGPCDYTAEVDAQRRQVAAMEKQADDARRQGEAAMRETCEEGLQKMQGPLFGEDAACAAQTKQFCARLQTLEGYRTFRAGILPGMESMEEYAPERQMRICGLAEPALLARLCPEAERAVDFGFVDSHCPTVQPKLCRKALAAERLGYISRHCPAEREELVAKHCAGRQYSSQISEKYRDFCVGALGEDLGGGAPATPAGAVQDGVKKGVEGLKNVFGL